MKKILGTALVAASLMSGVAPATAASPVEIGNLSCSASESSGIIVISSRSLNCTFQSIDGTVEHYSGSLDKYGLDLSSGATGELAWIVLAPTVASNGGALEGRYLGAAAEVTAGVGAGANVFVGGFDQSVTLQPVSVQVQTGLSLAAGAAELNLRHSGR
ncbi:DUF992 domain-containing protein [Coralliovum pocilloporae]|uniref:DUF992 domain-containing protein n=1 Tax=Coralliovum pocilloporae TaxID=3066369 RepID=UPI003306E7E7